MVHSKHLRNVIDSFFSSEDEILIKHQIDSFNVFMDDLIELIVKQYNPVVFYGNYNEELDVHQHEIRMSFDKIAYHPPMAYENDGSMVQMSPDVARLRNMCYSSNVYVDVHVETIVRSGSKLDEEDRKTKTFNKILIGKIPIMVNSRYCNGNKKLNICKNGKVDLGGYFIINGSEKVVISQERQAENKIFCFPVSSVSGTKYSHCVEVKSVPHNGFMPAKPVSIRITSKPNHIGHCMYVQFQGCRKEIPLVIIYRALGIDTDRMVSNFVFGFEDSDLKKELILLLRASIVEAEGYTQPMALDYITKYLPVPNRIRQGRIVTTDMRIQHVRESLIHDFLPHLGDDFIKKAFFLGVMTKKLLLYFTNRISEDDRDSFENKRVDAPGVMLSNLFRQSFSRLIKDAGQFLNKDILNGAWIMTNNFHSIISQNNIYKILKSNIIETHMRYSLATGNWGVKTTAIKIGVAQVLQRLSYLGTLSHLRRINTPIDKTTKMTKPRKLHPCTYGYICPAETPEGTSIGIVKNMALSCSITYDIPDQQVVRFIKEEQDFVDIQTGEFDTTSIYVNGIIIGTIKNMIPVKDKLISMRRKGVIHYHTSIVPNYSNRELHVYTSGGRLIRPVFIVDPNGKLVFDERHVSVITKNIKDKSCWEKLLVGDDKLPPAIEYLDVQESAVSLICEDTRKVYQKKYTHCDIDPSLILGILASNIVFSNHNQSPRNCYQCLDKNEKILMANGSYKPIGEVKIDDEVTTFDPDSMKTFTTKAVYQHVSPTDKDIYEVKTQSGRKIVATFDHKFMTDSGWKEIQYFNENTLLAVYPHKIPYEHKVDNDICILSMEQAFQIMTNYEIKESLIHKYLNTLKDLKLLPLYNSNEKLPIISGVLGFQLSDGSLNVYNKKHGGMTPQSQFNFGSIQSANEFEEDIKSLGFQNVKPLEGTRELHGSFHHTFSVCHSGGLAALLLCLGSHCGKRTNHCRQEVPDWIINGSDLVKREFLSGFQGGDGTKIRWNKLKTGAFNFISAGISQTIESQYEESLLYFMNQLKELYEYFQIEIIDIVKTIDKRNKDKVVFRLNSSNKAVNLTKIFENIGYKYDYRKHKESACVVEYFKFKKMLQKEYFEKVSKIRNYFDEGLSTRDISERVDGFDVDKIRGAIRSYKANREMKYPNFRNNTIEDWMKRIKTKDKAIYIPIKSIEKVENRLISDITTESESHSFITASGFAIHNSAMGKQAMGIYSTNYRHRMDMVSNILWYPSLPVVMTHNSKHMSMNHIPNGFTVIIAVMSDKGYNQEDSLMFNKSSIERGLFRSSFFRTYHVEERKNQSTGEEEQFAKPDPNNTVYMKKCSYDALDENGFPIKGKKVNGGDTIVGKIVPMCNRKKDSDVTFDKGFRDNSTFIRNNEGGIVDTTYVSRNSDGYVFCKSKIRSQKTPEIGDKFSSGAGQKGTIGMIYDAKDMPYSADGLTPDIIMNPHAFPSRMTFGQLLESLLGIECIDTAMRGDGTPFTQIKVGDIAKRLESKGYDKYGETTLYSGETGHKLETDIFIGPTFYQRLKHMVDDKYHARSTGPMVQMTRQPSEGRSRDGGLRIGEMEKDCARWDTPISLGNGLSVKIESMHKCDHTVLGYSSKNNGLVPSKQLGFANKGFRECVQLTLVDGRTLVCTPEHPILTKQEEWIHAKDTHKLSVKTGVSYPCIDIADEMNLCKSWELNVKDFHLHCKTKNDYLKSLAFARIIGYIITDGHVPENIDKCASIFLGHTIDVNSILQDLEYFMSVNYGKDYKPRTKNYYLVSLSSKFTRVLKNIPGILCGRRVCQTGSLPDFILDPNCPKPIIREFLGGLFGGDGSTCVLAMHRGKRDQITSIGFTQTKHKDHVSSLQQMLKDICQLLTKFEIHNTSIFKPRETSDSKKTEGREHYEVGLHIGFEDLTKFHSTIGFRHCCHKSQRLEAGVSYARLLEKVKEQRIKLVKRVDELTQYTVLKSKNPKCIIRTKKAIDQAVAELKESEPLIHEYAIPGRHAIKEQLIDKRVFGKFRSGKFPTAEEYMKTIDVYNWFVDKNYGVSRDSESLPTMHLEVIDIRPIGSHEVYDIEVENTHSFVANGVVAHNCLLAHGASQFLKEKFVELSDNFTVFSNSSGLMCAVNKKDKYVNSLTKDVNSNGTILEHRIPYATKTFFQEIQCMGISAQFNQDELEEEEV